MKLSEISKSDQLTEPIQFKIESKEQLDIMNYTLTSIGFKFCPGYAPCDVSNFPCYVVIYKNGSSNVFHSEVDRKMETIEWDNRTRISENRTYCSCNKPITVNAFSGIASNGEWYKYCRVCHREAR